MMLLGAEGTPVLIRFRNQSRTIIRKQIIRDCHADSPAPPPAPVAPITRSASASQYVQQQQQVQHQNVFVAIHEESHAISKTA